MDAGLSDTMGIAADPTADPRGGYGCIRQELAAGVDSEEEPSHSLLRHSPRARETAGGTVGLAQLLWTRIISMWSVPGNNKP